MTSPARTALDLAPGTPPRPFARMIDDALREGRLRLSAIADVLARNPRHPAVSALRPFVDEPNGPSRSDLERDFVALCARHGLPIPQTNTRSNGYEVDALFAAEGLIVELDGWRFHRDRRAFEADRERDANALHAGLVTLRITSERLYGDEEREMARLGDILERQRQRRRPPPAATYGRWPGRAVNHRGPPPRTGEGPDMGHPAP